MMVVMLLELLLVGYLPGALLVRLPTSGRPGRAALPAEDRVFLAVTLSVTLSTMLVLGLGAFGLYSLGRLLGILGALCAAAIVGSGFNLRLGPQAARPGWSALIPVAIVALGVSLYFPPAEWVLGGRDPGVYTNEGVRIAQRGSLKATDTLMASIPRELWGLAMRPGEMGYGQRFMGFLVEDATTGTVINQFPQLFPSSIAIGYGLDGLTGVRRATGVWGILGVLAVYFAGTVWFGRAAATAAAALLGLHVAQVWFARSPYSELPFQALLFAALYAYARLEKGGSAFFGLVAANLLGALMFLRLDAMIVLVTVAAALLLDAAVGRTIRWHVIAPLVFWAGAGLAYLAVFVRPYLQMPIGFAENLTALHWALILGGGSAGAALLVWLRRRGTSPPAWLPAGVVVAVVAAAGYAYFLRQPVGLLAPHDAYALRTFTLHYLTPYLLAAALAGFTLLVPRVFWTHTWLVVLVTVFAVFFFYKIRIVPEHFWVARRFLPVILPAMLLFAAAAFFAPVSFARIDLGAAAAGAWLTRARYALGIVVVSFAAWGFYQQTRPILPHVEYADVIPRIESLAAQIRDDDLLIIESRGASDVHVLGLPLAYIYGRNALILATDSPEEADLMTLFDWGSRRFARVLYMGSGGSRLLNRQIDAEPVFSDAIWVPEFERSWDHFPAEIRRKSFLFTVFHLVPTGALPETTHVEIGAADELAVTEFHAPEQHEGRKFRWTKDTSWVRLRLPANRPSRVVVWMNDGGRPDSVPPAMMTVFAGTRSLGSAMVTLEESHAYEFAVPPEVVDQAAAGDGFLTLRLETPTWNPRRALGIPDDRDVGVMVSRVELR